MIQHCFFHHLFGFLIYDHDHRHLSQFVLSGFVGHIFTTNTTHANNIFLSFVQDSTVPFQTQSMENEIHVILAGRYNSFVQAIFPIFSEIWLKVD